MSKADFFGTQPVDRTEIVRSELREAIHDAALPRIELLIRQSGLSAIMDDWVSSNFGVDSIRDLTPHQRKEVIRFIEDARDLATRTKL